MKKYFSKLISIITSTRAAGIYLMLFAIAIGGATFIENDYGTSAAQKLVFRSGWFELLLFLFGLTIIANIIRFKLVRQGKWATLTFHVAIIIILFGAWVTRYTGYEGMMHIREGASQNLFLSAENFINFQLTENGKTYSFSEPVLFASLGKNKFDESYQLGNNLIQIKLKDFIPNPTQEIFADNNAKPVIKIVFGGMSGREEYFLSEGNQQEINGVKFNFSNQKLPGTFNIKYQGDSLSFAYDKTVTEMVMATQQRQTIPAGDYRSLRLRAMYNDGSNGFVFGDFNPRGNVRLVAGEKKLKNESMAALLMDVSVNGKNNEIMLTGRKGEQGDPKRINLNNGTFDLSYGSKIIALPFSLRLRDFILEKYPGTDNPSSYASEVTLQDPANKVNFDQRIYMNHILTYKGYRFFQSSFDQDEKGTILSVNHDFWGTWISYIGYILLTLGMLFSFFNPRGRFASLSNKLKQYQASSSIILLVLFSSLSLQGQDNQLPAMVIDAKVAEQFSSVIVQDFKGRLEPVNTMSNEVLRKLARKESLNGYRSEQVLLSMLLDPEKWEMVPMIYVSPNPELQKILGTTEKRIAYRQFFDEQGNYKLRDLIRKSQMMNPKDQGTLEKAVIKTDEKVNIANMVYTGRLLKIYPVPGDTANTWVSPADLREAGSAPSALSEMDAIFVKFMQSLGHDHETNTMDLINQIHQFQAQYGKNILPSKTKINAELLLNKLNVFNRLLSIYGILSLVILGLFFYSVFNHRVNRSKITKYVFWTMVLFFIFYTLGLGLRWYISGRAPWSNGYESMIYIGWTTMLAGLIFSRKSLGGLAATTVLAATILMVASMSWLDPEISPLVPVLKSYWLTIHVSLEAGSYGFLLLGAVIGMLNLILYSLTSNKNKDHINRTISELTIVSEITLIAGLVMVSIGTYLGGVWANESWGRYWGWDAKETWALVTVLVYAFILHMRFIPGLQSKFAFNVASLFGFATVIMTYLGVNYYLSGLHSYAAGDPVPIPPQVYITTILLLILSIVAYINYRKKYTSA